MDPEDKPTLDNKLRKVIEPLPRASYTPVRGSDYNNPAVNLIRQKLEKVYKNEPNANEEIDEAEHNKRPSKHQKFLLELTNSGKSLVDIQTGWHEYYQSLPDDEKHQVWQEFYEQHEKTSHLKAHDRDAQQHAHHEAVEQSLPQPAEHLPAHAEHHTSHTSSVMQPIVAPSEESTTVSDIKERLLSNVAAPRHQKKKLSKLQHLKSLGFGLAFGGLFILIMLFGLFNEKFITPFITPSRKVSATPIIIDPNGSQKVDPAPKVIIPAINVEAPVVYDSPSNSEADIQKVLETGTYHYITTAKPGEKGNVIIFGHSSNNILNSGQYKFVFLALNKLNVGDQFILHYNGTRYVYKIFNKRVVDPSEVNILSESPKPAMATLITCDPPGTSNKRLLIEGEQISPSPDGNTASTAQAATGSEPVIIPGNAPSLWSRITGWLF